jgi:hypothetical protein
VINPTALVGSRTRVFRAGADLERKSQAVLQAVANGILALVGQRRQELV